MTNKVLYGDIFLRSHRPSEREDCALQGIATAYRANEEVVSTVLMWKPLHGNRCVGKPARTYFDLIEKDTGLNGGDLEAVMAEVLVKIIIPVDHRLS